ncbi:Mpo1 family 2-hydroxy fatty acid dioxygenase [Acinetobacter gandensis]|uniref:Mpo1 family 2-hydroxy fatty acid dioxygenase n=1 Tax=Acinetobacter gandensis TaxID=1443941 RepID=UPI003989ED58
MSKLETLLSQYAAYHLDHKNVLTHFVGIPLIVFSIMCLTARLGITVVGFEITIALVLIIASVVYYLRLDKVFGFIMLVIFAAVYPLSLMIAKMSLGAWLGWSVGLFFVGWVIQFIGHFYEKKKPAFMDDVIGLAIGPLFVLAELVFLMGFRKELEQCMLTQARKQRAEMDAKSLQSAHP